MNDALKYFNRENYRRALELFLEDLENASTKEERAYTANLVGLCLYFLHYPKESLKYFDIALENAEDAENVKVQENVNEVNRYMDRINRDIDELKEALEKEDDKKRRGILLSNLGLLYYFLGKRDEAERIYAEAEEIFKAIKDDIALGALYSNRSMLYEDMRKLDYLYMALDLFEREGHIKAQIETFYYLGMYYFEDDYLEEAGYFMEKALALVDNIEDNELKRRIYEFAADVYMDQNDVKKALEYTEMASKL